MQPKTTRYGFLLVVAAALVGGIGLWIYFGYPPAANKSFYKINIPFIGMTIAGLCFVLGHFSYPRIHNLKVYSFGYLLGLCGLGYFLLYAAPFALPLQKSPQAYIALVQCLLFVNIMGVIAAPGFVSYKLTKEITFGVLMAEILLVLIFRLIDPASAWALPLVTLRSWSEWPLYLGPFLAVSGIILSWFLMRNDFYLGGAFAGVLVLLGFIWCVPAWAPSKSVTPITNLLLMLTLGFACCAVLVHWFLRMEHRVSYDPLLHIYNRDYCSKIMTGQSTLDIRPPFGVAMVDIDHFKKVNDTYGHQAGDAVLIAVAQTICKLVVPQGIVCRYGGEELALFFPGLETGQVVPLMEQVRVTLEALKITAGKKKITVTVSSGVSHRSSISQSIVEVIASADKALYKAKNEGRNQVKSQKTAA